MNIRVPRPVAAYLEAEEAKDAERLTRCTFQVVDDRIHSLEISQ